jgi:hypothetical protein
MVFDIVSVLVSIPRRKFFSVVPHLYPLTTLDLTPLLIVYYTYGHGHIPDLNRAPTNPVTEVLRHESNRLERLVWKVLWETPFSYAIPTISQPEMLYVLDQASSRMGAVVVIVVETESVQSVR